MHPKMTITAATVLASLAATPALSQDYGGMMYNPQPFEWSADANPMAAEPIVSGTRTRAAARAAGMRAYAASPGAVMAPRPGVYSYGSYAGWDPDPNIRFQLRRDAIGGNSE